MSLRICPLTADDTRATLIRFYQNCGDRTRVPAADEVRAMGYALRDQFGMPLDDDAWEALS